MIPVFLGYDKREAAGFHVCVESLLAHTSLPFTVSPLCGNQRDGTNAFTYMRFLVPHFCNYTGWAIFADGSDMLFRDDIAKLWALRSARNQSAVMVAKRHYRTRNRKKYIGTVMESENHDYPCKNWSSLILFNCAHPANRVLSPEYVAKHTGTHLHSFSWLPSGTIGALPLSWNVLIGEDGETDECSLAHFTLGIPLMKHYEDSLYADEWLQAYRHVQRGVGVA